MFTYKELIEFILRHGARPIMASDRSGIRPACHIDETQFDQIIAKLYQLKDGPHRNWTYSIIVG